MIVAEETKNASKKSKTNHNSNCRYIPYLMSQEPPKKSAKNVCDCIDDYARSQKSIVVEDRHEYYFEIVEKVNWIDIDYDQKKKNEEAFWIFQSY